MIDPSEFHPVAEGSARRRPAALQRLIDGNVFPAVPVFRATGSASLPEPEAAASQPEHEENSVFANEDQAFAAYARE